MAFEVLREGEPISFREIKIVSLMWVSVIQHRRFRETYVAIQRGKKHCLQTQLSVKLDEYDILRCHGHYIYVHADFSQEVKCPKLLPRGEHFTQFLILDVHQRLIQVGVAHTLSQIRQEYWILQGRAELRKVISKCVVCKRHGGSSFKLPNMPA